MQNRSSIKLTVFNKMLSFKNQYVKKVAYKSTKLQYSALVCMQNNNRASKTNLIQN